MFYPNGEGLCCLVIWVPSTHTSFLRQRYGCVSVYLKSTSVVHAPILMKGAAWAPLLLVQSNGSQLGQFYHPGHI